MRIIPAVWHAVVACVLYLLYGLCFVLSPRLSNLVFLAIIAHTRSK